ncbi:MAG: D-alanine--D-alanine ligase [Chloroflexi bacterium]|nr:D-alanine--D-alanine ligase [Chloroflexota bacterium]MCI0575399.1 D-alanine--D-alanine ligase [Chloroflexota bacterium]MCI0645455.1 D-alanine--D-alanine ligase [Chloroflexota bacterium]MCI0726722.1 D-alanine--D-alanine ligase [Chloroflexota bacterium]
MRVGVIFGGRSGEHEVSLMSARSVLNSLDPEKYDVVLIGITKSGQWLTGDVTAALEAGDEAAVRPAALLPDPQASALMRVDMAERRPAHLSEVAHLDVVFPVLHGPYGEDGTVQGLLELAGLPYVGSGVVGSAVGMDKAIFKQVMQASGLPVLPWHLVLSSEWARRPEAILDELESRFTYPVFTKPANLGSSVGVSKCRNRAELAAGLADAARYDRRLLVEQGINARELEVSVLGNDDPIASVVGEIRPRREFYDYVAKYVSDDSELIIPAELDPALAGQVRSVAVQAFRAIDGAGLARVDFLLDKDNGRLYLNELNTIPGFTRISMYPKLWEASGISYGELLDRLVELALERHEAKSKLETAYEVKGDA